jgi:DNA-binding beta-propeller fold protein YncE
VDTGNNRVVKWSSDDVMIDIFPRPPAPPLARPQGIAVDRSGRIWISETQRHRVVVFDPLLRPIASYGGAGEAHGQFQEPQDLAITPDGCVLVSDGGNDRVQVLDANGAPLQVLGPEEGLPRNVGALSAPSGITVRGEDEAYIADTGNHRVLRMARR